LSKEAALANYQDTSVQTAHPAASAGHKMLVGARLMANLPKPVQPRKKRPGY
jgi:hypothetical protein